MFRIARGGLTGVSRSTTMRVAVAYGLIGIAWALGNLMLARVLPAAQYGIVALFIALTNVAGTIAPLGAEEVVRRRFFPASWAMLLRGAISGLAVGLLAAILAVAAYGIDLTLAALLCVGVVGHGSTLVVW